jgi:golgi-specific brefeldin A-resistance guanine nucleotide exchange factor 1
MSFDLITTITSDGPDQLITGDNFVGLVTILDDFATVAGTSTESKQVKGRRNEPLTSSKYVDYTKISRHDLDLHSSSVVARGKRAIDLLFNLHKFLSQVIDSSYLPKDQGLITSSSLW